MFVIKDLELRKKKLMDVLNNYMEHLMDEF